MGFIIKCVKANLVDSEIVPQSNSGIIFVFRQVDKVCFSDHDVVVSKDDRDWLIHQLCGNNKIKFSTVGIFIEQCNLLIIEKKL